MCNFFRILGVFFKEYSKYLCSRKKSTSRPKLKLRHLKSINRMDTNKYGIQESRKVVSLLADIIETLVGIDSNKDGKVQGSEIAEAVFKIVMQAPGAFGNFEALKQEFGDLNPEEQKALANYFSEQLDLPVPNVEGIIEDFVMGTIYIVAGVQKIIAQTKKE
jgi:hypothetical protein